MDPLPHEPSGRITLCQARVPACLLAPAAVPARTGPRTACHCWTSCSRTAASRPWPRTTPPPKAPAACRSRAGWSGPCFVDMHTHLDKGHIWPRAPNPDGSFAGALERSGATATARWTAEDVARAHGVRPALRLRARHARRSAPTSTCLPPQAAISWPVFAELRERWARPHRAAGRRPRRPSSSIAGRRRRRPLPIWSPSTAGILGRVTQIGTGSRQADLDRVFALAARARPRPRFPCRRDRRPGGSTRCGTSPRRRCATASRAGSLPAIAARSRVQPDDEAAAHARPRRRGRASRSSRLPMCNLYLQDRQRRPHAALARRHAAARDEGARHPGRGRLRQHPRPVLRLWRPRHARGLPRGDAHRASRPPDRRLAASGHGDAGRDHAAGRTPAAIAAGAPRRPRLFGGRDLDRAAVAPAVPTASCCAPAGRSTPRCPTYAELDDLFA